LKALETAIPLMLDRLHRLHPPPVRRPPLLIAGVGERRTLRLVAQYADGWHAMFPSHPSELEPKIAALRRWCDEIGRDPAEIEWGVGLEPGDLERFLARDVETYTEMGFTQFTLGFNGPDWPVDAGASWLSWRDARNANGTVRPPPPPRPDRSRRLQHRYVSKVTGRASRPADDLDRHGVGSDGTPAASGSLPGASKEERRGKDP
jgi:hypothetical protein